MAGAGGCVVVVCLLVACCFVFSHFCEAEGTGKKIVSRIHVTGTMSMNKRCAGPRVRGRGFRARCDDFLELSWREEEGVLRRVPLVLPTSKGHA